MGKHQSNTRDEVNSQLSKRNHTRRKERIPLGVSRQKLTVSDPPRGKMLRWVNDTPGRIQQALAGGYELVRDPSCKVGDNVTDGNTDMGSAISQFAGRDDRGKSYSAYLMAIDQDLYNGDQEAKRKQIDKVDKQIHEGKYQANPNDKRYVPNSAYS